MCGGDVADSMVAVSHNAIWSINDIYQWKITFVRRLYFEGIICKDEDYITRI